MKPLRVAVLILAVLAIGLALVIVRHLKSERAYEIHRLHAEQGTLQRQLAGDEAAVAGGQGPDVLAERVQRLGLPIEPPAGSEP